MAKSIVIFQSDYFARPEANTPEEIEAMDANPWGKDLAGYIVQELEAKGFQFIDREPKITNLVLWYVIGRKGPETITFFCGCQPINKQDDLGHWQIEIKKHKGCLPALLGIKASEEELQWFSMKELGKLS